MKSFHKILFATDFSDCSANAQAYAFAIASHFESELHIAHAIDIGTLMHDSVLCPEFDVDKHIAEMKTMACRELERTAEAAKCAGIRYVHKHLLTGPVAETIAGEAELLACDVLIVSTHGHSGFNNLFIGNNAERIVRLSSTPVISVKPQAQDFIQEPRRFALNRILCPCDLSANAEQAAAFAADLCRVFDAKLTLLFVVDSRSEFLASPANFCAESFKNGALEHLKRIAAKFDDVETEVEVTTGMPPTVIVETAASKNVDLIVITTYGRSGPSSALLASTAEKVVRMAPAPIMTVRPAPLDPTHAEALASEGSVQPPQSTCRAVKVELTKQR